MRKRQRRKNNKRLGVLDIGSMRKKIDKYFRNTTDEQLRADIAKWTHL